MKKKGFALIELLVVIGIIGLISGIIIVGVQNTRAKTRDTQKIQNFEETPKGTEKEVKEEGKYSLEAWVKLTQEQGDFEDLNSVCKVTGFCEAKGTALAIVKKEPVLYHAAYTELEEGKLVAFWHLVKADSDLTIGQWYFLTATYGGTDDSVIRIYINGDFKNSKNVPGFIIDEDVNLFIGSIASWSDMNYTQGHFQGMIDEVRVYDYQISANIVEKHFQGDYSNEKSFTNSLGDRPAVAYWRFEEGEGGTTVEE